MNNEIRKIRRRLAEKDMKLKITKRSLQIISSENLPIVIYPFTPSRERAVERCSVDGRVIMRIQKPKAPKQLAFKF